MAKYERLVLYHFNILYLLLINIIQLLCFKNNLYKKNVSFDLDSLFVFKSKCVSFLVCRIHFSSERQHKCKFLMKSKMILWQLKICVSLCIYIFC